MIVKQDLFNVGLSREGHTDVHIYIEAENMEKALQVTNEVLNTYYKYRKITSISYERDCYRYT